MDDRACQGRAVLIRSAALFEERRIGQLDINSTVLERLDRAGDFNQPVGAGVGICEAARFDESHARGIP